MDDLSMRDERIERALHELRHVNRFLGGYRALHRAIEPMLRSWTNGPLSVLDLGAGLGDHAAELIELARRHATRVHVTCADANPAAVESARNYLDRRLSTEDRARVKLVVADVHRSAFATRSYHVVTASLLLHHFDDDTAVALLREMDRIASVGIVINDLHRHPAALLAIRAIAALLPVSPMFEHDGPQSVRRAFRPVELEELAHAAELPDARLRRHLPFRLTLSTLPS